MSGCCVLSYHVKSMFVLGYIDGWLFSEGIFLLHFGNEFSDSGGDRVVVGSLDLNQCVRLPDEITGMKPEGIGADFARAYLSNVCVAKELQRNGLGYALIAEAKTIAQDWGISDLYVHVAFNNEGGKKLYMKSGFVYESDEPSWQARFLDRPRRILFWTPLSQFPL
ncbi:Acetyltransf_1 domain-containing protein [Cucumis melo var. makuwa]|uniref:Acetyltransf_1 domain-containing protein n=1 Tax=Cucumis melo var. makuwa TaxID=1194695 RepID=A0A5A7U3B4_CUCMM|nr:Acetyltransf_1 domain-containing protein [Cucumis melo var. makuwa]